jgi:hypothetical protein
LKTDKAARPKVAPPFSLAGQRRSVQVTVASRRPAAFVLRS